MNDNTGQVPARVESLLDAAMEYGRLIWLDAAGEIVILDKESQGRDDRLEAEEITRTLMASDLQAALQAVLMERRIKALATLHDTADPPTPG